MTRCSDIAHGNLDETADRITVRPSVTSPIVGRHRIESDGPGPLLPPTVEQLALQERAGGRQGGVRKPVIVAVACAVLLGGAGVSWALSRPDAPTDSPGGEEVAAALPSAGYEEGFGRASPSPSPSKVRPPVRVSPSAVQSSDPPVPIEVAGDGVSATYRISAWEGAYKVDFILVNKSPEAAAWTVRIELPANANVRQYWNAELATGGAVTFTPPLWDNGKPHPISAGGQHEFGFIVDQPSGPARLVSCTIDGLACRTSS